MKIARLRLQMSRIGVPPNAEMQARAEGKDPSAVAEEVIYFTSSRLRGRGRGTATWGRKVLRRRSTQMRHRCMSSCPVSCVVWCVEYIHALSRFVFLPRDIMGSDSTRYRVKATSIRRGYGI